ncbi:Ig-like domain-containing protein [Streptomyces yaanensis]|uniref:Ig-like domain-containing protein n=1 Tax=Streptomyces yaanensis TaxID=1142239 RepID=A0ABV7S9S9_9ACTN|nr:Ig-like domain-containing protein [Streptomyces sp. CGMCC 4.7035]WNC03319.1 Ig-like domain-containing protein [Streptomyces sp. CGMCC 4.7035]
MGPVRVRAAATAAAAAVLLTAALSACSADGAPAAKADSKAGGHTSGRPATVTVTPHGTRAKAGEPVKVAASGGTLTSVTVTDARGGRLTGTLSHDGRTWTSNRNAVPGTTYTVKAATRTKDGTTGDADASFTTAAADKVNKVDWRPGSSTTVGVAQPISLVFDNPVRNKAAVEKQLKVTTSNNTEGSWGWMKDWSGKDRVDWRPKEYWRSGTRVTLDARLNGTDSGTGGGWFVRDYKLGFTVGARQVVKVDLDSKRLTMERDGKTVRSFPVSGGTPGPDTGSWRGTEVVMAKEGTIRMNSETVGLGNAYDQKVDYSMRLTWSGTYAHAAPWNAAYFGRANRSHGCIGMSDANAAWLYGHAQLGDPFEVKGAETKGEVALNNGFGDWNVDWDQWRAKSALR